jgi:hypothetical protein
MKARFGQLPKIQSLGVEALPASRAPGFVCHDQHDQNKQRPTADKKMENV